MALSSERSGSKEAGATLYAAVAIKGKRLAVAEVLPCFSGAHRIIVCVDSESPSDVFAIAQFKGGQFQNNRVNRVLLHLCLCRKALTDEPPDAIREIVPSRSEGVDLLRVTGNAPLTWLAWFFSRTPLIAKMQIARADKWWLVGTSVTSDSGDRLLFPEDIIDVDELPLEGCWRASRRITLPEGLIIRW